ncbi:TPA: hypothetical protein KKX05_002762 [Legionella pneumophila]|nr:hypothetical protein [Legionella pneumophila]HAT7956409.1 hypothetical protein [Legionella pneumophila]HAU1384786.1 hypothetical protein [Legionella pneumophila]HAU2065939.1 hypothetical protein [Legionella pneumophila]HBD7206075.1 hypothetical protein [Legionella pneumophila]
MNKVHIQDSSLIKTLNYFLVFYIIYILVGVCFYHFATQEATQALAKAPENKKQEVFSTRIRLYSHYL